MRRAVVEAARSVVDGHVPEPKRLRGEGADRYEAVLAHEGLGAAADRPIPEDLADALTELSAIRDVLVHRAGRIDKRALKAAPSLRGRYRDGELIRVTREDYRIYSAAVRCYAMEVLYRPLRSSPAADDATHGPDLANWRGYAGSAPRSDIRFARAPSHMIISHSRRRPIIKSRQAIGLASRRSQRSAHYIAGRAQVSVLGGDGPAMTERVDLRMIEGDRPSRPLD
jgi:hypothetical protein